MGLAPWFLFVENAHAMKHKCGDPLIRAPLISVPSILKPVGTSSNTEIISTFIVDTPGVSIVKRGTFFFVADQQKQEIEIEHRRSHDLHFLNKYLFELEFKLVKRILDQMPAVFLSKVNKVTVLFTGRFELSIPFANDGTHETLQLEEADYTPMSNEITLVIPYFHTFSSPASFDSLDIYPNSYFNSLYHHLIHRMRHKLGHIMAYYKYGQITPDQRWRDAILADNQSISQGNINMAENFAETMELYLRTNAGFDYPDIAREYAHRFKVLDEIIGLDSSQRR